MLLEEKAEEIGIPDELSIIQYLKGRKQKFEKFIKDYDDYRRQRENLKNQNQKASDITSQNPSKQNSQKSNQRYSLGFVNRLIQECRELQISKDDAYDYDEGILLSDIKNFKDWRERASIFVEKIQETDDTLKNLNLQVEFQKLRNEQTFLPISDKDLSNKLQCIEWLYTCQKNLTENETSSLFDDDETMKEKQSIQHWENLKKQTEKYLPYFPAVEAHPIYQSTLWEVQQAQSVIDFVQDQKNNIKNWGSKFNLDKNQNYAEFRNKLTKGRVSAMLDKAKSSNINLNEEIRVLANWINEYDKYNEQFNDGSLTKTLSLERLKDILKIIYVSPINYDEIFFKLKEQIDTVDMIKIKLKQILEDHELWKSQQQQRDPSLSDEEKLHKLRLKFSKISYELKLFKKSGKISGVREIESLQESVNESLQQLNRCKELIAQIDFSNLDQDFAAKKQKLEQVRKMYYEVEMDMEDDDRNIKKLLFESDVKFLLQALENQKKKVFYEEINELEKIYQKVRNDIEDINTVGNFVQLKNKVFDIARKINNAKTQQDLSELKKLAAETCPQIDFSLLTTDKLAKLKLKNRLSQDQQGANKNETSSEKEQSLDKAIEIVNKKKRIENLNTKETTAKVERKSNQASIQASSENESSDSSSSGSDDDSSNASSSSSDGSNSSDSDSSQSAAQKSKQKIVQQKVTRPRREIVPNLNSDYIYSNPSINAVKSMQQARIAQKIKARSHSSSSSESGSSNGSKSDESESDDNMKQSSQKRDSSVSSDNTEKKNHRKEEQRKRKLKRKQKDIERLKKQEMQQGLIKYRLAQNKTQQTIQKREKLVESINQEQTINLGSLLEDKDLQSSLQRMKTKIREDAKKWIRDSLNQTKPVFSELSQDKKNQIVNELEEQIRTKHPEVDSYYQDKARYASTNIKYLSDYKLVQEHVVSQQIPLYRLIKPHPEFKSFVQTSNKEILLKLKQQKKEAGRKQYIEQKKKEQKEIDQQRQLNKANQLHIQNQVASLSFLEMLGSSQPIQAQQDLTLTSQVIDNSEAQRENSRGFNSDEEMEGDDDSNPALFSDQEEVPELNNSNQFYSESNQANSEQQRYDPSQIQNQVQFNQAANFQNFMPRGQQNFQPQIMQGPYQPDATVNMKYGRMGQLRPYQNVLYDPIKARQQQLELVEPKNIAPPGSLLKVWEGQIEVQSSLRPTVSFYSNYDISIFQQLPKLPTLLPLKGKAKIEEVIDYFLKLRRDQKVIRGWITRKGHLGEFQDQENQGDQSNLQGLSGNWQENSDKYCKFFDELDQSNKVALFNAFQGVTLYLIPINRKTQAFCQSMGIKPEAILPKEATAGQDLSRYEETHCFAVVSQIKNPFENRENFLNPQVLRLEQAQPRHSSSRDSQTQAAKGGFSPISSDDENGKGRKSQNKSSSIRNVKQEQDSHQFQSLPQPSQLQLKSDLTSQEPLQVKREKEEQGEKLDIDEIINQLRQQEDDVQSIQAKLIPIIGIVKGEDETKLYLFLQELIQRHNNRHAQREHSQALVKQENPNYNQTQRNESQHGSNMDFGNQQQNFGMSGGQPIMFGQGQPQPMPLYSSQGFPVGVPPGMAAPFIPPNAFSQMQGGVMFPGSQMLQSSGFSGIPPIRPPPPVQSVQMMGSQPYPMQMMHGNMAPMIPGQQLGGFMGQSHMIGGMMIPQNLSGSQPYPGMPVNPDQQLPPQQFIGQFQQPPPTNQGKR